MAWIKLQTLIFFQWNKIKEIVRIFLDDNSVSKQPHFKLDCLSNFLMMLTFFEQVRYSFNLVCKMIYVWGHFLMTPNQSVIIGA